MAGDRRRRVGQYAAALLALGLVMGLGLHLLHRPGVYFARTYVILYPPQPEPKDNPFDRRIGATVDFAGLVARSVGGLGSTKAEVSRQITLLDQDVRQGWFIRQPSQGGQWNYIFDQPTIEIQVTGPTATFVRTEVERLVDIVVDRAHRFQDEATVPPANRVRVLRSPEHLQVIYAEGNPTRAVAAIGLAGLLAAGLTYGALERVLRRRAVARSGPRVPGTVNQHA